MKRITFITMALLAGLQLTAGCGNKEMIIVDNGKPIMHAVTYRSRDDGQRKKLTVNDRFNGIHCVGVVDIHFKQDAEHTAFIDDPDNLLKHFDVSYGQLVVDTKNKKGEVRRPQLFLTAPSLKSIDISGVSTFNFDTLDTDELSFNLSGVSKIFFNTLRCKTFNLKESGVSKMQGHIEAEKVSLDCSGVSKDSLNIKSDDFKVKNSGASKLQIKYKGRNAEINNSGTGTIGIHLDCDRLRATNSGVAKLSISGTADDTKIDGSGVSKVDASRLNSY